MTSDQTPYPPRELETSSLLELECLLEIALEIYKSEEEREASDSFPVTEPRRAE